MQPRQCLIWGREMIFARAFKRCRGSMRSIVRKMLLERNFVKFRKTEEGIGSK